MDSSDARVQLRAQLGRTRRSAAGQRSHDESIHWAEVVHDAPRRVSKLAGYAMAVNCPTDGFGHDESHEWGRIRTFRSAGGVHDKIGLRCTHAEPDGVSEIRRPCHPVSSREHWCATRRSGSQRTTAFATPLRHDGTAGAGAHTQPEAMDPGPAPVVRLKGALALGHRCSPRLLAITRPERLRVPASGLPLFKACCRTGAVPDNPVAAVSPTFGRLFEGTEVTSAGQTAPIWAGPADT